MKKTNENDLRTCGCCHEELPVEAFYTYKRTRRIDSYCKDCRKSATNNRYHNRNTAGCLQHGYPVITQVKDPKLRMTLILHAWKSVNESIVRKRRKQHEEEEKADRMHLGY